VSFLLKPTTLQLIKLGSIAVHAEELIAMSDKGDAVAAQFDVAALRSLLQDPDIRAILDDEASAAFLPQKRDA